MDSSELTLSDEFFKRVDCGMVLEDMADHQYVFPVPRESDELAAFTTAKGQRLLDEYIFPRQERLPSQCEVLDGRSRYDDAFNLVILQNRIQIPTNSNTEVFLRLSKRLLLDITHPPQRTECVKITNQIFPPVTASKDCYLRIVSTHDFLLIDTG